MEEIVTRSDLETQGYKAAAFKGAINSSEVVMSTD